MAGDVTFTPTRQDYVQANRLWAKSARQQKLLFWIGLTALGLATANILFHLNWGVTLGAALNDSAIMIVAGAVLLAAPLVTSKLLGRSVARMFAQRPSLADPVHARWDEEAIVLSASNGVSNQPWATLHRWIADQHSIVFLPTDRMMLLIPTRALSPEQITDLKEIASRCGPIMGTTRK